MCLCSGGGTGSGFVSMCLCSRGGTGSGFGSCACLALAGQEVHLAHASVAGGGAGRGFVRRETACLCFSPGGSGGLPGHLPVPVLQRGSPGPARRRVRHSGQLRPRVCPAAPGHPLEDGRPVWWVHTTPLARPGGAAEPSLFPQAAGALSMGSNP